MTKVKLFAAVAVLSTLVAAPAMAQTYHRDYDNGYRDRGPVGDAVGIAGAAVGTAAAIATSPLRDSRDSYAYDNERDYGPNGYACHRGAWFKGADGRRHMCQ